MGLRDQLRHRRQRTTVTLAGWARKKAPGLSADAPGVAAIVEAAREYEKAREQYNSASRRKRVVAKILKGTPGGQYGPLGLEWEPSSRETPDLEAIRATFAKHKLGDVPMKKCAPSPRFTWAEETANTGERAVA